MAWLCWDWARCWASCSPSTGTGGFWEKAAGRLSFCLSNCHTFLTQSSSSLRPCRPRDTGLICLSKSHSFIPLTLSPARYWSDWTLPRVLIWRDSPFFRGIWQRGSSAWTQSVSRSFRAGLSSWEFCVGGEVKDPLRDYSVRRRETDSTLSPRCSLPHYRKWILLFLLYERCTVVFFKPLCIQVMFCLCSSCLVLSLRCLHCHHPPQAFQCSVWDWMTMLNTGVYCGGRTMRTALHVASSRVFRFIYWLIACGRKLRFLKLKNTCRIKIPKMVFNALMLRTGWDVMIDSWDWLIIGLVCVLERGYDTSTQTGPLNNITSPR